MAQISFATMTSATNFNDEQNPSFTFNNPANSTMSCWLEPKPNGPHIAVRSLSGRSGTFTWNLTEEERNQLRARCVDGNSCKCRIGLYSTIGSSTQASYKDMTMTIVNANPTFNDYDYNDINPTTLALTGNNKYNINGYSTIRVLISQANKAVAQKGATMVKYQLMIGNETKEIAYSDDSDVYIDLPNASIGEYKVYAIDSRNNSTLVTKLATQNINYEPLYLDRANSNTERDDGGIGENVTLNYRGTIWNDSFGQVSNAITVSKYEFKKVSDSQWITGATNITPTISENSLSFSGLIRSNETGYIFSVQDSYNFRITLQDKLSTTVVELTPLPSGTPNISLNKNGVGIMCDYDETLGGLLQVGGEKYEGITDTGWQNLTLKSGVTADTARYRKIGNIVYLQIISVANYGNPQGGAKEICTIPEGFRPSLPYGTGSHSSWDAFRGLSPCSGNNWVRWEISSHTGKIVFNASSTSSPGWSDVIATYPAD